jgi:hypothetical protein
MRKTSLFAFTPGVWAASPANAQPDEEPPYPVRTAFNDASPAQRIHFLSERSRHMSQAILLALKGQWLRSP